ncbi:MAG: gamma carbonic anhydrase family protein, partial [Pseudomonadota bacterium]
MPATILPYQGIWPKISQHAFIASTAVIIGDVEIGAGSSIWYGCVLRGDVNVIRVGENTNIQDGTVVHVSSTTQGSYIGDNITIGHMALIHACTLEDGCFIGMKACVMDDAKVASGAMVGAGALVTPGKQVGSGELWLGSPAKKARMLNEDERAY